MVRFTTNVGDVVTVDDEHHLRFAAGEGPGVFVPYVDVRHGLEARINRAVYYDLVAAGSVHHMNDKNWFGIWSGGQFWPIAPADEIGIE